MHSVTWPIFCMKIFIALCSVNDHMLARNVTPIDMKNAKEIMKNTKFSRQPYLAVLEERKKAQLVDWSSPKRKQLIEIKVIIKREGFDEFSWKWYPMLWWTFYSSWSFEGPFCSSYVQFFKRTCKAKVRGTKFLNKGD